MSAHSDVVVSGDKDLLRMGRFAGIEILTVAEYLRRLAAGAVSDQRDEVSRHATQPANWPRGIRRVW
jgi:hypothetical protein